MKDINKIEDTKISADLINTDNIKLDKPKTKSKTKKTYVGKVQMSKGRQWITSRVFKKKANAQKWVDDKRTRGNVIDSKVE